MATSRCNRGSGGKTGANKFDGVSALRQGRTAALAGLSEVRPVVNRHGHPTAQSAVLRALQMARQLCSLSI